MKQLNLTIITLIAVFGFSTTPIYAQDVSTTNPGPWQEKVQEARGALRERKAELEGKREAVRERAEDKKLAQSEKAAELSHEIAKRKAKHAASVLEATVERLRHIADRIDSRIDKAKERGGDTAEAEAALASARGHLDEAEAAIDAFKEIDLSGDTLREKFEQAREAAKNVKHHLRLAHQDLMRAVRSLHGLGNGNATSTPPATTQ